MLQADAKKVVFLFAGHCVSAINRRLNNPDLNFNSVGVNLDPRYNSGGDAENYVADGIMVRNPAYNPKNSSLLANSQDLAVAVFSADATNFKGETIAVRWGGINGALTPAVLTQDVVPSLETVVNSYQNPNRDLLISAAGFGSFGLLNKPGSNKGGPLERLVDGRQYADHGLFLALHPYMFIYSENPARDHNGPCYGDSGGPNYVKWNNQEVVAGVTSSASLLN